MYAVGGEVFTFTDLDAGSDTELDYRRREQINAALQIASAQEVEGTLLAVEQALFKLNVIFDLCMLIFIVGISLQLCCVM